MASSVVYTKHRPLQRVHSVLLSGTATLFLAALLGDIVYAMSYEVQWKNTAAWLLVGGLVLGGVTLLLALPTLYHRDQERRQKVICFVILLVAWLLGTVDALVHAEDAWGSMPEGLVLSAVVATLALLATGVGFSTARTSALP
jgi:uncharacterized membrane protein